MPRIRSILVRVEVDEAKRAHNCQANRRHRLRKGDKRLKVQRNRSWEHYCVACGERIIGRGIDRLERVNRELTSAVLRVEPGANGSDTA